MIRDRIESGTTDYRSIWFLYLLLQGIYESVRVGFLDIAIWLKIFDAIEQSLPFIPILLPEFSAEVTVIEHLIVFWICIRTTHIVAGVADFFPDLEESLFFWGVVGMEWLLFIYFLILLGDPFPLLLLLPVETQMVAFLYLAMLPLLLVCLIPWAFGILSGVGPHSDISKVQLQPTLTAVFMLPATLATIFRVGPLFEIMVLVGILVYPVSRVLGWEGNLEKRLIRLITRLGAGNRGFAMGIVVLVGLYLASWAAGFLWSQLTFLRIFLARPDMLQYYPPFFLALVLLIVIGGGTVFWWTGLSYSQWAGRQWMNSLWVSAIVLLVEGAVIFWLQTFLINYEFPLRLSNPVFFAIALAIAVIIITELHQYEAPREVLIVGKIAVAAIFLPVFFESQLTEVFSLFTAPIFAYTLTPVIERGGRYASTLICP